MIITILFILFSLRVLIWAYNRISFKIKHSNNSNVNTKGKIQLLVVLGSGGHTAEMLMLLKDMDFRNKVSLSFIIAETDKLSKEKAIKALSEYLDVNCDQVYDYINFFIIKRSREVHQSYISSIFSTIISFIQSLKILYKQNYDLLLVNGPGTCIPVCFGSLLLEVSNNSIIFNLFIL